MTPYLVFYPLLVPFLTGILSLLFWRSVSAQKWLGVVGALLHLAAAGLLLEAVINNGVQAAQSGNWAAPFGITIVADLFSAIMVLMASIVLITTLVYSLGGGIEERYERQGYYALLQFLILGVCGAFLTGDIFNLYVWYEVMLIASFVLLVLGGERSQLEGGIKYVTLNLIASALFLVAVGILYGTTGSLNMADLHMVLPQAAGASLATALGMLFLFAFGIKAALFPLFFWLPASYHTPPTPITVIFSGLMTKVGIYSLVRMFTLVFTPTTTASELMYGFMLFLAAMTMITGVLGAVAQYDMRRLLSFHIVSQIGYLLMGLAIFSPLALAGTIFFLVHVILAKSALFLVGGVLYQLRDTFDLKQLGGYYRTAPWLAVLFALPAFSLAGIPPLSGFWAKYALVRAGLEGGHYLVVAAALGVSMLTLFSMTKIWNEAFLKEEKDGSKLPADKVPTLATLPLGKRVALLAPIAVIAVAMVGLGLLAEPVFALSLQAAEQLLNPNDYLVAVLGGGA